MAAEKNFENRIKKYLKSHGAWYIKYWAGAKFTKTGIPDILCCYKGHFVAIEVKAEDGVPSDLQLFNVRKIRKAGGIAVVLYPHQWEEFKEMLEKLE